MANLGKKDLKHLSQLSSIDCSEEEEVALLKDLGPILESFEILKEVDTKDIPPFIHVLENMTCVMREDIVGETLSRDDFLGNAPDQIDGMIRVPPVINKVDS